MSKHLISRVVMLPDGTAHIALSDRQTVACTPANLSELLSDPYGFIEKGQFDSKTTTRTVNPTHTALESIRGLTLLRIYSDAEIVCVFPKLFQALFASIGTASEMPLDLTPLVTSMDLSDEKHFLMKFFFDFTGTSHPDLCVQRKLGVSADIRNEIMQETFNTLFMKVAPEEEVPVPDKSDPDDSLFPTTAEAEAEEVFVRMSEFAKMHNVPYSTVQSWKDKEKLRGVKEENGKTWINKNSPIPEDGRKNRKMPPKSAQGINKYINTVPDGEPPDRYLLTQQYIRDNEIASPELGEFIHTYEEAKYYERNHYHEVNWDGRRALIIDIQPDYVCKETGLSNRELIRQNKSPKVPGKEAYEFHVHHIGQKSNSPFAIIPGDDHLSKHSLFHTSVSKGVKPEDEVDLHDETFKIQKIAFWNRYLKEYDKTGSFQDIQYTNLKHKKNGKNKSR